MRSHRRSLPRPPLEEGLEEDPRAELVRRLQEYERFKRAAEDKQRAIERKRMRESQPAPYGHMWMDI